MVAHSFQGKPFGCLAWLLAHMKAAATIHQTHHWQTRGPSFYADHVMFARIYDESLPFIDQVAEKLVALSGTWAVEVPLQAQAVFDILSKYTGSQASDAASNMAQISKDVESSVLVTIQACLHELELLGELTPGLSNLLEGVADKHEEFVYLLQQRTVYSYDRVSTAGYAPEFFEVWAETLGNLTQDLDLSDSEDRMVFRSSVQNATRNLKADGLQALVRNLGVTSKGPSREALSRAIADAYISGKKVRSR